MQNNNITPENALKHAEEFMREGNSDAALDELHQALHNRRLKGNNLLLEKIMLFMIDICSDNLTISYLKEDIGHFRNLCQHTNMNLLENVLKTLRNKADQVIQQLVAKHGQDKVMEVLNDDLPENTIFQESEVTPDDLIFLANCEIDTMESKHNILPSVQFFTDISKIILDSLRQNSKLLDFYNSTAKKVFDFCSENNYRREYVKVSETLHSHFNQILKQSKHPELLLQTKIPFPVKLEEDESLNKVLELRYEQLKIALKMKEWSDAFRTSENIYQLINRQKQQHQGRMKSILSDFFFHLSGIFWESEFYLFHSYALMNLQQIIKTNKSMNEVEKTKMTTQFILAALSIPLNNRLSNFERLSVYYVPQAMSEFIEESTHVRNELFSVANMLQVKGYPSRASLINHLRVKNIHLSTGPEVQELFRLIEEEDSPFVISQRGKAALEAIINKSSDWAKYASFITKTLSVRILQKCRNYFKNLKFSSLQKLLVFYNTFEDIETLLYECNREGLVRTVIDHRNQLLTFNQEEEVAQNLFSFGNKLRNAFQKLSELHSEGKERERIFQKVKEKMEEEMGEVFKRKQEMERLKQDIALAKLREDRSLQDILQVQQIEKDRQFQEEIVKDQKERQKNKLLEELELMRKIRAKEVLQELIKRNIKKIGKEKVVDIDRKGEYDYDLILTFYQNILRKEKEAFENEKKKKTKDVEYWAKSLREEEKVATEKYCAQHGEEEMKHIQQAIQERHKKELIMKKTLSSAAPFLQSLKDQIMRQRRAEHEQKVTQFVNQQGELLRKKILDEANSELKKIINQRKVKEAEEKRRLQMKEKEQTIKITYEDEDGGSTDGWARNSVRQPVGPPPRKDDGGAGLVRGGEKQQERVDRGDRDKDAGSGFISRDQMNTRQVSFATQSTDDKPAEEKKGPMRFTNSKKAEPKKDEPPMTRSGFGVVKKEEEKQPASDQQQPPRSTAQKDGAGFGGFRKQDGESTSGTGSGASGPAWRFNKGGADSSKQQQDAPKQETTKPATGQKPTFSRGAGASQASSTTASSQQSSTKPKDKDGGDDGWTMSSSRRK